ncbi:unnamed protein product [[Candida] boidinii]|uniref:Unnamed protein product n=1 Tax=Candida boidinii TaxID=5477 RepID=A0A9W6SVZ8_CANBO|nr:hypothetical protein B5S30_g506 [[Candida] boidinii]GME68194.1 unnamed protein product [[Candida] boidinii]
MSIIIEDLNDANPIIDTFLIPFTGKSEYSSVVNIHNYEIKVYDFKEEGKVGNALAIDASSSASLKFDSSIVAANHILPHKQKSEWLIALTQLNELYIISFSTEINDFVIIEKLHFKEAGIKTNAKRLKETVDHDEQVSPIIPTKAYIKVDENNRFIIVHSINNFIQILELHPEKFNLFSRVKTNLSFNDNFEKQNELSKRLSSYRLFDKRIFSFNFNNSINSSKLIDISFLKNEKSLFTLDANGGGAVFAIVYRDLNMDYMISFFQIIKVLDQRKFLVDLIRTFKVNSDDSPELIIPLNTGGLMVMFNTEYFIYSPITFSYAFRQKQQQDTTKPLLKGNKRVIHQLLKSEFSLGEFTTYLQLNDSKILLLDNFGNRYLISIDFENFDSLTEYEKNLQKPISSRLKRNIKTNSSRYSKKDIDVVDDNDEDDMDHNSIKNSKINIGINSLNFHYLNKSDFTINSLARINNNTFIGSNHFSRFGLFNLISDESSLSFSKIDYLQEREFNAITSIEDIDVFTTSKEMIYSDDKIAFSTKGTSSVIIKLLNLNDKYRLILTNDTINFKLTILRIVDNFEISTYKFNEDVDVFDIITTDGLKFSNEFVEIGDDQYHEIQKSYKNGFIVLSNNSDTSDNSSSSSSSNTSEIILFCITDDDKLTIETVGIFNTGRFTRLLKADSNNDNSKGNLLCISNNSIYSFTLKLVHFNSKPKFKFQLRKTFNTLQLKFLNNVAYNEKLNVILLSDLFAGIHLIDLNETNMKVKIILRNLNITVMRFVSDDNLIIGDIFGNLIICKLTNSLNLKILNKFNLNSGPITALSVINAKPNIEVDLKKDSQLADDIIAYNEENALYVVKETSELEAIRNIKIIVGTARGNLKFLVIKNRNDSTYFLNLIENLIDFNTRFFIGGKIKSNRFQFKLLKDDENDSIDNNENLYEIVKQIFNNLLRVKKIDESNFLILIQKIFNNKFNENNNFKLNSDLKELIINLNFSNLDRLSNFYFNYSNLIGLPSVPDVDGEDENENENASEDENLNEGITDMPPFFLIVNISLINNFFKGKKST